MRYDEYGEETFVVCVFRKADDAEAWFAEQKPQNGWRSGHYIERSEIV